MHKDGPIIKSLLDNDLYKWTMKQAIDTKFPDTEVQYNLTVRNKNINLIPYMDEISEEIDAYCGLKFTDTELNILGALDYMKPSFMDSLELYQPRKKHIKVIRSSSEPGQIDVEIKGLWKYCVPFEVPVLAIVNEVYFRNTTDVEERMAKGKEILSKKIKSAQNNPQFSKFRFNDFGTRRRFSRKWHEQVLDTLKGTMPIQLIGSSNVLFAHKFGINVMGTMAHEWLMGCQAAKDTALREFQKYAFDAWADVYQGRLGIALTDAIGMNQFVDDFGLKSAKLFDGLRHDSGDPLVWAEKAIDLYKKHRIDPLTKSLVFSDNLTFPIALNIEEKLEGRARPTFGIGTYLTNDTGVPALDIVLKMTSCNGQPVAKISDSPGKTTCKDPGYVTYLKDVFGVKDQSNYQ